MPANRILFKQTTEPVPPDDQDHGSSFYQLMQTVRFLNPIHWFDGLLDDIKIDLEDYEFLEKNLV